MFVSHVYVMFPGCVDRRDFLGFFDHLHHVQKIAQIKTINGLIVYFPFHYSLLITFYPKNEVLTDIPIQSEHLMTISWTHEDNAFLMYILYPVRTPLVLAGFSNETIKLLLLTDDIVRFKGFVATEKIKVFFLVCCV